jgi:hypothetical protein
MSPRTPPNDTSSEATALLDEGYRRMSAAEKLERVRALNRTVQALALADVQRTYPDADRRTQELLVASRWLEPEIMRRVFGWSPPSPG